MADLYEMNKANFERVVFACCGVTVLLPEEFMPERRKNGQTFYCPNGHPRVFKQTDAQRIQKELDAVRIDLKAKSDKLQSIKTGKCPWCSKTVKNLSGHIKRNHP